MIQCSLFTCLSVFSTSLCYCVFSLPVFLCSLIACMPVFLVALPACVPVFSPCRCTCVLCLPVFLCSCVSEETMGVLIGQQLCWQAREQQAMTPLTRHSTPSSHVGWKLGVKRQTHRHQLIDWLSGNCQTPDSRKLEWEH